jgi:hypothetical protein
MLEDVYNGGPAAVNPQRLQILPPRPRLAGRAHTEGWNEQARALRAHLKAVHQQCPLRPPKGGSERVGLEIIEHLGRLDAQSLCLLRFAFSELFKLSVN